MRNNLVITGGSGLLALNWAVVMRDRYTVTLGLHNRNVSLDGVRTHCFQLESIDELVHAFAAIKPYAVIHTAGLTNVDECEAKPDLARHINVKLAENVAKACAKLDLPLVHISTDHLFSGELYYVDETKTLAPQNVYARTKSEAECRVLESYAKSLIIRTNFYGWGPSYRRSFSDMVIDKLRMGEAITLFTDVFYTPILIEVLVDAIHQLIEKQASGIFNVVSDERVSKYEFGLRIADTFNLNASKIKEGTLAALPSNVRRPQDMSLSNQKISQLLGHSLGGVDKQLAQLRQQEQNGQIKEIKNL